MRARGFSRLELVVYILLFALLGTGLLGSALYYEELAESTSVTLTLRNMRSGMRYRMAELAIRQGKEDFGELLQENPLDWLSGPSEVKGALLPGMETWSRAGRDGREQAPHLPGAGELPSAVARGWAYDTVRKQVVYRPRLHRYLSARQGGELQELRYRVVGLGPSGGLVTASTGGAAIAGLRIEPVVEYSWL